MKLKKAMTVLVLALAMVGALTLVSSAASGMQEIRAYLDSGITITMDGETQTFLDANGNRVYPISYQGTTYLPVRAVAGLVGLEVDWDQPTRTVLLGKPQDGIDLIETYKAYYLSVDAWQIQSVDKRTEDISGISCDHWLGFWKNGGKDTRVVSFNLLGKHDTLTFSYYADRDTTLTVLGDNDTVLGEYTITGGAVAQTVTIPLFKTNELKFQMEMSGVVNARIFNAYLDVQEKAE